MNAGGSDEEDVRLAFQVQRFISHEASLLDCGRFAEWLDLFDDNGVYWIPSSISQTDRHGEVSIVLENKALLEVRVARLDDVGTHALDPRPATVHLTGNVLIDHPVDSGELLVARSSLMVMEQRGERQTHFAGTVIHHLREETGGFKIMLKRVALIQCGAALPVISIPL